MHLTIAVWCHISVTAVSPEHSTRGSFILSLFCLEIYCDIFLPQMTFKREDHRGYLSAALSEPLISSVFKGHQ